MDTIKRSRLAAAAIHVALLAGLTGCSDAPTLPHATTTPEAARAAFGPKPADGLLVFSSAAGAGGPQVYTYSMATKTMKQITQYFSAHLGVSPDAKRVARFIQAHAHEPGGGDRAAVAEHLSGGRRLLGADVVAGRNAHRVQDGRRRGDDL
jgi:hypothetical protein